MFFVIHKQAVQHASRPPRSAQRQADDGDYYFDDDGRLYWGSLGRETEKNNSLKGENRNPAIWHSIGHCFMGPPLGALNGRHNSNGKK